MASSKKLPKNNAASIDASVGLARKPTEASHHPLAVQFHQTLATLLTARSAPTKLLLALSGGLDSSVLLHLLAMQRLVLPFEVYALHVHHGLSAHADAWASACAAQCQALHVPLQLVRVQVPKTSKLGIEAAARALRYQALFAHTVDAALPEVIVTAHHQNDQAETLLLQLFRGAGVKGLASMAASDEKRRLWRPLLEVPRQSLHDYAVQHGIVWCDDDSNSNTQFERNFIRHAVMPNLHARYPSLTTTLARTASHMAEADALLMVLAEHDAKPLLKGQALSIAGLQQLTLPRAKNVLRWWFAQHALSMPSAEHLAQIIQQLLTAKQDAQMHIALGHLSLRRYQHCAYLVADDSTTAHPPAFDLVWQGEPTLTLPDGSTLHFQQVLGAGLALKHGLEKLRITHRKGGERFKPHALRPTRTLKFLLQAADIPPWQRVKLPLIYWQDTLVCIPNVGVTHALVAKEAELGLQITWQDQPIKNQD